MSQQIERHGGGLSTPTWTVTSGTTNVAPATNDQTAQAWAISGQGPIVVPDDTPDGSYFYLHPVTGDFAAQNVEVRTQNLGDPTTIGSGQTGLTFQYARVRYNASTDNWVYEPTTQSIDDIELSRDRAIGYGHIIPQNANFTVDALEEGYVVNMAAATDTATVANPGAANFRDGKRFYFYSEAGRIDLQQFVGGLIVPHGKNAVIQNLNGTWTVINGNWDDLVDASLDVNGRVTIAGGARDIAFLDDVTIQEDAVGRADFRRRVPQSFFASQNAFTGPIYSTKFGVDPGVNRLQGAESVYLTTVTGNERAGQNIASIFDIGGESRYYIDAGETIRVDIDFEQISYFNDGLIALIIDEARPLEAFRFYSSPTSGVAEDFTLHQQVIGEAQLQRAVILEQDGLFTRRRYRFEFTARAGGESAIAALMYFPGASVNFGLLDLPQAISSSGNPDQTIVGDSLTIRGRLGTDRTELGRGWIRLGQTSGRIEGAKIATEPNPTGSIALAEAAVGEVYMVAADNGQSDPVFGRVAAAGSVTYDAASMAGAVTAIHISVGA